MRGKLGRILVAAALVLPATAHGQTIGPVGAGPLTCVVSLDASFGFNGCEATTAQISAFCGEEYWRADEPPRVNQGCWAKAGLVEASCGYVSGGLARPSGYGCRAIWNGQTTDALCSQAFEGSGGSGGWTRNTCAVTGVVDLTCLDYAFAPSGEPMDRTTCRMTLGPKTAPLATCDMERDGGHPAPTGSCRRGA